MTVSDELAAAIDIFTELGWSKADLTEAPTLPLGTDEQRRVALAGLRTGEWGEFGQIAERTYGWISFVDVDDAALALFAIRLGVDARRAAHIMPSTHRLGDDLAAEILATRGPEFAQRFVERVCVSSRRAWEHATSVHAGAAVRLIAHHRLPIPQHIEYLKDWAVYALGALTGEGELFPAERGWVDDAVIAELFADHARAAVAAGLPATGPFPATLMPAIDRGWIDRAEVVELCFAALDSAQRPGDRKAWLRLLTDELAVDETEFVERADAMVSLMSFGDGFVIEAVAPILIAAAAVDDDLLVDVLTVALNAPTKKARRVVLTAAAARHQPGDDTVAAVAELIADDAADGDQALARAAAVLRSAWAITASAPDTTPSPVQGLWQPTPEVWQVPRFDPGEATVETVTDAAALLLRRYTGVVDVEVERFLALANRLAHDDPDGARVALGGVRKNWIPGLAVVRTWLHGEPNYLADRINGGTEDDPWYRDRVWEVLHAREGAVVAQLGYVPVLLSTPTWVDLRIHPDDLLARLDTYAAADVVATEADLFAALTRLDTTLATAAHRTRARSLAVPVQTSAGTLLSVTAGRVLASYLDDPVVEPRLVHHREWDRWVAGDIRIPNSLSVFPKRLAFDEYRSADPATLPTWGDAAGLSVGHGDDASAGVLLRQIARRTTPLTPGLAVNMIGAQRGFHRGAAADGATAVVEAWQRGLLRPGVADARFLDWQTTPSGLAALARAGSELADEGMLSVLWPLFDDLIAAAVHETRMPPGAADLVEALDRWLPETQGGVDAGVADVDVLDLPGVRALAARSGSSRAVAAARALVARLPEPTRVPVEEPVHEEDLDFDEWWRPELSAAPAVDDGAVITATWEDASAASKFLCVDLEFPDRPGEMFRIRKGWFYDLEHEGQCAAVRYTDGDRPGGDRPDHGRDQVWLRWDEASKTMIVGEHRNWVDGTDGPVAGGSAAPLTTSMTAVVLVGACHGRPDMYSIRSILRDGLIGSGSVAVAMRALLTQPDVSPARLVRLLERDASLLPVLWPILVESIRYTSDLDGAAPRWLNRVLDVALLHAPLLREAGRRGLIPAEEAQWPGLDTLASRLGRSAASTKAKALVAALSPAEPHSVQERPDVLGGQGRGEHLSVVDDGREQLGLA
ncbi:hypothetical protein [Rhodococcus sp. HNM0563]|uniref:hypothetical protein n=1 Tax=Rhodococcus sp. HNM0563 TaxID=2716339 RepID=UPI00197CE690|nr:hypothetical protein [Rhodococcus sp. HNM0563]